MANPTHSRQTTYKIITLVAAIFIGFVCFEIYFLIFPDQLPPVIQTRTRRGQGGRFVRQQHTFLKSARYSWVLQEAHYELKNHPDYGYFRIDTYKVPSLDLWVRDPHPQGPYDAVAIGDSFVFGQGVLEPQSFVSQVEKLLSWNILNMGVPGWSPGESRYALETYLPTLKPKRVIYFLYANDLNDELIELPARTAWEKTEQDGASPLKKQPLPRAAKPQPAPLLKRLWFNMSKWCTTYQLLKMIAVKEPSRGVALHPAFYKTRQGVVVVGTELLACPDHNFSSDHDKALALVERDISAMLKAARKQGADFILFYIPRREQVYFCPEVAQQLMSGMTSGHQPEELVTHTQRDISKFARAQRIPFFDLTPDLQKRRDDQPLYFKNDEHFTPYGYRLASLIIAKQLRSLK